MEYIEIEEFPDRIDVICRHCNAPNSFNEATKYEHESDDGCFEEYTIGVCRSCNEIGFFYREDVEMLFRTLGEFPDHKCLWPQEKRFLDVTLPKHVGESYSEAVHALKVGLLRSGAVMVGRTLEAICLEYNSSSKNIFITLKQMLDEGALNNEMYEWANELRILRNAAAHISDKNIEKGELEYALDFLQALLTIIYIVRPKFKHYREAKNS